MILKLYCSHFDKNNIENDHLEKISLNFNDKEYSKTINKIRIVPIIMLETEKKMVSEKNLLNAGHLLLTQLFLIVLIMILMYTLLRKRKKLC